LSVRLIKRRAGKLFTGKKPQTAAGRPFAGLSGGLKSSSKTLILKLKLGALIKKTEEKTNGRQPQAVHETID